MTRIYTRTGDKGETGLIGGARVPKDALRVQSCGDIDELNSILGLARAFLRDKELDSLLQELQRDLSVVSADLSTPIQQDRQVPRITSDKVVTLETTIDKFQEELQPLTAFIIPGGGQVGSILHFARTVARRAERSIVALSRTEKISDQMIPYFNRLSDLLFVIARVANHRDGKAEVKWHSSE
jgi:cob(I)alamin adenosyltransferase